jgi:hypothetical protein
VKQFTPREESVNSIARALRILFQQAGTFFPLAVSGTQRWANGMPRSRRFPVTTYDNMGSELIVVDGELERMVAGQNVAAFALTRLRRPKAFFFSSRLDKTDRIFR